MRTLIVSTFLTLDGVMQAPGGPEEDPSGGFTHGGWSFGYWDEMMGKIMDANLAKPFDLLLGRRTYEVFAAHWPHAGDDPAAVALNSAKKHVASRSLKHLSWANSTLLDGDVAAAVAELKRAEGPEIQVHGSAGLIQTLLSTNLIDEYRLWVFPVVVGPGKRLFGEGAQPAGLSLVDSKTSTTGVTISTYKSAGAIRSGSFALEEPSAEERERRARNASQT